MWPQLSGVAFEKSSKLGRILHCVAKADKVKSQKCPARGLAMFNVSLVATALVVALSLSAQAQIKSQTDLCWDVNRPHGDQPNPTGTILFDRCSGKTFLLWQATDQSLRWFPLRVEEKEKPRGEAGDPSIKHLFKQAPAYTIEEVEVTDSATYQKYLTASASAIPVAGGRFIVRGGTTSVVNGAPPKRIAVIQWESMEKAKAYFESDAYKRLIPIRDKSSNFRAFVIEGAVE